MSKLKDIFNAFDKYEEAISNQVDYKIKMRNDTRHMKGYTLSNSNFRPFFETRKAKGELYETIKQFVDKSQTKNTRTFQNRRSANTRKRMSILL
jgi:hypothetical protein